MRTQIDLMGCFSFEEGFAYRLGRMYQKLYEKAKEFCENKKLCLCQKTSELGTNKKPDPKPGDFLEECDLCYPECFNTDSKAHVRRMLCVMVMTNQDTSTTLTTESGNCSRAGPNTT